MSMLKSLMVDTKSAWLDYPGLPGFQVKLATLARQELINLRKRCLTTKFDRRTRQAEEVLDDQKFIAMFSRATVKDWKGLKYKYVETLVPVDISAVNPDDEMPFTPEDAELLVANSGDFDTWINESVFDLENFRTGPDGDAVGETGEVAA